MDSFYLVAAFPIVTRTPSLPACSVSLPALTSALPVPVVTLSAAAFCTGITTNPDAKNVAAATSTMIVNIVVIDLYLAS